MSPRKTLTALAAAGAVAVAVPAMAASTASAAGPTVDPTVCQLLNSPTGLLYPSFLPGGASLASTLAHAGSTVGCAAPSQPSSPFPALPMFPAFPFSH